MNPNYDQMRSEELALQLTAARRELAAMTARAEAAERERYNYKLRAIEFDMLANSLEKRVSTLAEKLLSEMKRAEAAEAQLAAVPDYATYYWQAYTDAFIYAAPRPMTFADWLAAGKPKVHP